LKISWVGRLSRWCGLQHRGEAENTNPRFFDNQAPVPINTLQRAMSTKAENSQIRIQRLSADAKDAAKDCGELLCKEDKFKQLNVGAEAGQYEIWSDNEGLMDLTRRFINSAASLIEDSSAGEIRITALRFTKTATIPVKPDSWVDLIPVSIISGKPSISSEPSEVGQPLEIGQCIRLKETACVEPAFICLLLLSQ